jgi:hypothetical protein
MDEIGVIAVDSSPHVIVPLNTVEVNASQRNRILSIDSMGGGIFIYEALSAAASTILNAKPRQSTSSCLPMPPIRKNRDDTLSCSKSREAEYGQRDWTRSRAILMQTSERHCRAWRRFCYFTDSPEEIPRLFAQDTFTVARSTFIDQATLSNSPRDSRPWEQRYPKSPSIRRLQSLLYTSGSQLGCGH